MTLSDEGADAAVSADAVRFTLVVDQPLSIGTVSLPDGVISLGYSEVLVATGGAAPYTWSVDGGDDSLPSGLSLNASSGELSGTPDTQETVSFTVRVADGNGEEVSQALSITVGQAPPPAPAPLEVVVDDQDAEAVSSGSWATSSGSGPYAGHSAYANQGGGTDSYRFTPDLGGGGSYEVSVWWTTHGNRSSQALYEVTHAGGEAQHVVDQRASGGQWNVLGTYSFTGGTSGFVTLSDEGADAAVSADAVRFTLVGGQ